ARLLVAEMTAHGPTGAGPGPGPAEAATRQRDRPRPHQVDVRGRVVGRISGRILGRVLGRRWVRLVRARAMRDPRSMDAVLRARDRSALGRTQRHEDGDADEASTP